MWIATWWRKGPDASGTLDGYCRTLGLCPTSRTSAHKILRLERLALDWQPWSSDEPDASCHELSSQTSCLLSPWPLGQCARRLRSPRPVGLVERGSRCEAPSCRSRDQLFLLEWVKFIWAVDSSHQLMKRKLKCLISFLAVYTQLKIW